MFVAFCFFKQRQPFESWWILLPCFVHNQFQWCPVPLVFFSRPHLSQLRQQIGVSSFNTPGRQLVGPSWKTYAASAPRFKDEDGDGNAWTVGLRCQDIYFRIYIYIYIFVVPLYLQNTHIFDHHVWRMVGSWLAGILVGWKCCPRDATNPLLAAASPLSGSEYSVPWPLIWRSKAFLPLLPWLGCFIWVMGVMASREMRW